jgi:hypothetical protein
MKQDRSRVTVHMVHLPIVDGSRVVLLEIQVMITLGGSENTAGCKIYTVTFHRNTVGC